MCSSQIDSELEQGTLKGNCGDFPGGPVARFWIPNVGAWFPSLLRELDLMC